MSAQNRLQGPPEKTRFEVVIGLVRDRFLSIVGVIALLIGVGMYLGVDPEIPRFWKIALGAGFFALPIAYLTGSTVVKWLYSPMWFYLLDVSAAEEKGALYRLPEAEFRDLEVLDGELDRVAPMLYIGKRVDLENGKVAGTWRGTLSDRDLLMSLRKVRECRGILEKDARRGFILDASAFIIVRRAVHETTKHVINTFQKGTLPDDGEAIGNAIDDELDEFGVRDSLDEQIEELREKRRKERAGEGSEGSAEGFEFVDEPDEPDRRKANGGAPEAAEVKL